MDTEHSNVLHEHLDILCNQYWPTLNSYFRLTENKAAILLDSARDYILYENLSLQSNLKAKEHSTSILIQFLLHGYLSDK